MALLLRLALTSALSVLACGRSPSSPPSETPAGSPGPTATNGAGAPGAPSTETPPPSKSGPQGALCGGIAGFGCAAGLYCAYPVTANCGAADQSGTCQRLPEMCTEQFAPVCGCNDKTYANDCYAAREGISVATTGECLKPPEGANPSEPGTPEVELPIGQTCGTRGVRGACAPGLYCAYRRQCGADDSGGQCAKKPEACTRIYAPVCGCDSVTYGNACMAASAGFSVAAPGECKP